MILKICKRFQNILNCHFQMEQIICLLHFLLTVIDSRVVIKFGSGISIETTHTEICIN